jgi:hypothetical protein
MTARNHAVLELSTCTRLTSKIDDVSFATAVRFNGRNIARYIGAGTEIESGFYTLIEIPVVRTITPSWISKFGDGMLMPFAHQILPNLEDTMEYWLITALELR